MKWKQSEKIPLGRPPEPDHLEETDRAGTYLERRIGKNIKVCQSNKKDKILVAPERKRYEILQKLWRKLTTLTLLGQPSSLSTKFNNKTRLQTFYLYTTYIETQTHLKIQYWSFNSQNGSACFWIPYCRNHYFRRFCLKCTGLFFGKGLVKFWKEMRPAGC